MTPPDVERLAADVRALERQVLTLRQTIWTLIAWIGQSAGSPLSHDECRILIRMAEGKE